MENWSTKSSVKDWAKLKEIVSAPLDQSFYQNHTIDVAQMLLGKILVVRQNPSFPLDHPAAKTTAARIVETEAYRADDPASHCSRGITPRSSVMFEEPGRAYVYFIYGMYEMLNFVTEPLGCPGAVLIRAVEPIYGIQNPTNGPGKLCRTMGIKMFHNRTNLSGPILYVGQDGQTPPIESSKRIGIREGKEKLWRFFIRGNPFVSGYKELKK